MQELRRKIESFIGAIRVTDPDAADRLEAALEQGWYDEATLLDLVRDSREILAEELRQIR